MTRSRHTDSRWAVDSPAGGTGLRARPCGDTLRPAPPPPADAPVAVALSGGGFRATLAALGVLRFVADARMMPELRYASSVSGGSIANGLLAARWPALRRRGFTPEAVDELLTDPTISKISSRSLKKALLRGLWRTVGSATRTELLARRLDEWFFDGIELADLDPQVRWILNAANLTTGARFTFERDVHGDYTIGLAPTARTGLRLSVAVAASAAVPGAFPPLVLHRADFPCATDAPALLDGGVYDNTGSEALDSERYREVFLLVLNSGGLLRPGAYGGLPIVRDLARANSLLYRQSTALRTRLMVERFQRGHGAGPGEPVPPGSRRGVLMALATDFPDHGPGRLDTWREAFPEHRAYDGRDLSLVPTVFDRLDEPLCRALVHRGWWLTGAALATYHPHRLPDLCAMTPPPL
ncbi:MULTISPECIES: patatin-like phospholipase family protein [unclassified Streptomyces]|uniref:patatin-like phospholipase family protein n=1 Tax=unclassified Streptomyces TaxID=2593676 RepID=UPI0036EA6882